MALLALLVWLAITLSKSDTAETASKATRAQSIVVKNNAFLLRGHVTSSTTAPIAGTTICASGSDANSRFEKRCASGDNRGAFSLTLEAGNYRVTASAPLYGSRTAGVSLTQSDQTLDFALDSGAPTLEGVVKDGTGRAVEQAHLAISQAGSVISNVTTDTQGHFSAWAPPGAVVLQVSAAGFSEVHIQSSAPAYDINITLYPGFAVKGEVLYERTMQPVAHVRVTASLDFSGKSDARVASAITDDYGRFTMDGMSNGKMLLSVGEKNLWGRTAVDLNGATTNDEVQLLVRSAVAVSGKFVMSEGGAPCTHGLLELIPSDLVDTNGHWDSQAAYDLGADAASANSAHMPPLNAAVNENGTVIIPAVPSGQYRVAPHCFEHLANSGPVDLKVDTTDVTGLQWKFQSQGRSLIVRVVDQNNNAITAAAVSLQPIATRQVSAEMLKQNASAYATRTGETAVDGTIQFGGVDPGAYEVVARGPGISGAVQAHKTVSMQAEVETGPVILTLPAIGSLLVYVHTPDGKPVSRLLFFANDSSGKRFEARFTGSGRYTVGPLPRGSYNVYAYDNKNPKIPVPGAAGDSILIEGTQPVQLDLSYEAPQGTVEGVVTDANGKPAAAVIQAVSVTLTDEDDRYSGIQTEIQGSQYRMTDARGHFSVDGLLPGATYRLFVQGKDGQRLEQKDVAVGQFVQLTLPALSSIAGVAVDAQGKALQNFILIIRNSDNGDQRNKEFHDVDGRFNVDHLNPGNTEFTLLSADHELHGVASVNIGSVGSNTQLRIVASSEDSDSDH